jgi:ectoine hydroxylase-related dioxygenase (phytanoyl-CoA dioxygenase family)
MTEPALDFEAASLPWVDRDSFPAEIDRRRAAGELSAADAELVERWRRQGYLHLAGAVEEALVDRLLAEYEEAWRTRPAVRMLVEGEGVVPMARVRPRDELGHHHYRILDFQDVSETARRMMLHPGIVGPLRLILDQAPVAMQSLFFEYGSEQRIHQDFPYVQAEIPSHLAASWVACDEVGPDNGPLFYFPGSHRLPKFDWGEGRLLFDGADPERVAAFEAYLESECGRLGFERQTLAAKKGDVFLWHAALAHGGSPARDRGLTRRSLVTHYSSPSAYRRDRRFPDREPEVLRLNGGMLYLAPSPGPWQRAKSAARRLLGR